MTKIPVNVYSKLCFLDSGVSNGFFALDGQLEVAPQAFLVVGWKR